MAMPVSQADARCVDELPFDIFDLAGSHPSTNITFKDFRRRIVNLSKILHPDKKEAGGLGAHHPPGSGSYPSMSVLSAVLNHFKDQVNPERRFQQHRSFWQRCTRSTMNSQAMLDGVTDPQIIFSPTHNWPEGECPYFMP